LGDRHMFVGMSPELTDEPRGRFTALLPRPSGFYSGLLCHRGGTGED
jgi:hypothetical protein